MYFSVEKQEAISILKFNRAPSNNLNIEFMKQLGDKLNALAQDQQVRCVVLSSAIPKYFSAGLDLNEIMSVPLAKRHEHFHELFSLYKTISQCAKPTIAAINGYAFLGGWIIAMACDFRYLAQENGKIALSEIRIGVSPTDFLVRVLACMGARQSLVKEMILTGKTLNADEALEGSFVDKVVPQTALLEESLKLARKLAEMPSRAYASIKKSYRTYLEGDLDQVIEKSKKEFLGLINEAQAQEGFAAMSQKRRPRFR